MTPQFILRASLCRTPFCAGPYELRDTPLADWPIAARESYLGQADNMIECMDYCDGYAEPGYNDPPRGILFANWNYFYREIGDILERAGYAIEWEDEWTRCGGCKKALRTSPDSYSWQPSFITTEDDCYCVECLTTEDIDATFQNDPCRAVNLAGVDMTAHGYVEIQCGFESGGFPGQNDNPQAIYDDLVSRGYRDIVFQVNEQSQFYIGFCVWHKES
jgi:hypothetical protein